MNGDRPGKSPGDTTYPAFATLEPLRIPAGWCVNINKLDRTSRVENGDFGGSSIFHATHEGRRFVIDVAFTPEFDPAGSFRLEVLYQPWPRTDRGARRHDVPFRLDASAQEVGETETADYAELIGHLENWIARCTLWQHERS